MGKEIDIQGKYQLEKWVKPLQMGLLPLRHNVLPAPLAGYTDLPFRNMLRALGAHLTYMEMVNINSISSLNRQTQEILTQGVDDFPVGLQLLVQDPEDLKRNAEFLGSLNVQVLDINLGCPMPKVTRKGGGVALMQQPEKMARIIESAHAMAPGRVTAKIRIGFRRQASVKEIIPMLEESGAVAITIHGRKGTDSYQQEVDYEWIAHARDMARVPIIGNGNIFSVPDAIHMFEATRVDGIMLGRGILQRPALLKEILNAGGITVPEVDVIQLMKDQYEQAVKLYGEPQGIYKMRKKILYWLKGMGKSSSLKLQFSTAEDVQTIMNLLDSLKKDSSLI